MAAWTPLDTSNLLEGNENPEDVRVVDIRTMYEQMPGRKKGPSSISPWFVSRNRQSSSTKRNGTALPRPIFTTLPRKRRVRSTRDLDLDRSGLNTIAYFSQKRTLQTLDSSVNSSPNKNILGSPGPNRGIWTGSHSNLSNAKPGQSKQARMLSTLLNKLEDIKVQDLRTTRLLLTPKYTPKRFNIQIGGQPVNLSTANFSQLLTPLCSIPRHIRSHTSS